MRGDELDASWRIWTGLLKELNAEEGVPPRLYPYGKSYHSPCLISTSWWESTDGDVLGSTGPEGLEEFMENLTLNA